MTQFMTPYITLKILEGVGMREAENTNTTQVHKPQHKYTNPLTLMSIYNLWHKLKTHVENQQTQKGQVIFPLIKERGSTVQASSLLHQSSLFPMR